MSVPRLSKQKDETVDFRLDFSARLAAGDSISSVATVISPAGATVSGESHTSSASSVRIAGGTAGTTYRLTVTATCTSGLVIVGGADVVVEADPVGWTVLPS